MSQFLLLTGPFTAFVQKFLEVVPPPNNSEDDIDLDDKSKEGSIVSKKSFIFDASNGENIENYLAPNNKIETSSF